MVRRVVVRSVSILLGLAALGTLAWWAAIGSARVRPLPPPPPDEGQEERLQIAYLEALAHRRPEHWAARANLADLLALQGRDAEAVPYLRDAARLRPGDVPILRSLALASERAGFLDEQVRAWNAVARRDPGDVEARVRLSGLYRQMGWYGLSRAAADSALRIQPDDPDALRVHAALDFVVQDYRTAIQMARRLLEVDPHNAVGHSVLSHCLREQAQWEPAISQAEAAVNEARDVIDYRVALAQLYLDRPPSPQFDRALAVLDAAPTADPKSALARRYWIGICHDRMGQLDAALADLTAVYQQKPDYEAVAYHLGRISQKRGDTQRATAFTREYQQVLSLRAAVRDAESALRLEMNSPERHLQVARAALAAGEAPRAVLECRTALRLKPGDPSARRLLDESLQKMGRSGESGT
jgi:tetratricopeptide (TPR) repeat protein